MDIILYLIQLIQHLYKQNCWLVLFICKYIPLKQWAYDDSKSPAYQKFKIDELPRIISYEQDWKWNDLITYYEQRYGKTINQLSEGLNATFLMTVHVLYAMLLSHILHGMMVKRNLRSDAKSALTCILHLMTTASLKLINSAVLIAHVYSNL